MRNIQDSSCFFLKESETFVFVIILVNSRIVPQQKILRFPTFRETLTQNVAVSLHLLSNLRFIVHGNTLAKNSRET